MEISYLLFFCCFSACCYLMRFPCSTEDIKMAHTGMCFSKLLTVETVEKCFVTEN